MSTPKPPKGRVSDQAKVLSAFMQAFGKTLMSGRSHHQRVAAQLHDTPEGTSRLWARNAKLIMEEGITLLLDQLQAEIVVYDPLSPMIPEKREGYAFNIQIGRLAMDELSISNLMNRYAFPPEVRSPLYDLKVSLPEGAIVLDGTLRVNRLVAVGLHLEAALTVTPQGMLELTPTEIRSGALPVSKIMGFLGVELARLLPRQERSAMWVEGDRILIDPTGMFPAPKASGKLIHAEVTGAHLVMTYDNGAREVDPPLLELEAGSYIAMLGHDLLVGKTTMTDVCLQLVALDPEAEFVEFSLPHYRLQLAQGESSLKLADEVLYKLPAVAQLKALPLPPARPQAPKPPRA
jgi:hypothetical protein